MIDSTSGFARVKTAEEAEAAANRLFDQKQCDSVPDEECDNCPGCKRPDGSYCPAHPNGRKG